MTRLPAVTGKDVISALCKDGWVIKSHHGIHVKIIKPGVRYPIIIPVHGNTTLPKGTLCNIIKDTGLTVDEFT